MESKEEEVVNKTLDLDKVFKYYQYEHDRIQAILGMDKYHANFLLDIGFVFDYNDFVFKIIYNYKINDTLTIPFNVVMGKSSDGYYLSFRHNDTSTQRDFTTHKDFDNYINPLNVLFQLKSFVETDKKIPLYFTLLEDIKNCIKNKSGYIEIENSKISADGYSTYPVAINNNEVLYQSYTNDVKRLEGRNSYGYGYHSAYHTERHYKHDDKDLIKTSEGYYVSWRGKKFISQLSESELETFSKILIEPLETAKNKKTFKKFVEEENKLENHE